jgi:diguanylate cyclase (GGDEF)-like protein
VTLKDARKQIRRWWAAVSFIGVPPLARGECRSVIATNQFMVYATLGTIPYVAFFFAHWPDMRQPAITATSLLLWWVIAFVLNSRKQYALASTVALLFLIGEMAYLAHWFTTSSGFHYFLFAGGVLGFLLFRPSQWPVRVAFTVLSVALFLVAEAAWRPESQHHPFEPSATPVLLVANVAATVLLLYAVARFDLRYYEQERQRNAELLDAAQVAAQTDALTEVLNRRGIAPILSSIARRGDFALALVDLDRFKLINDRLGHGAGDVVLSNVARTLSRAVGDRGVVARWGGEEFLVAIPGLSLEESDALMERTREAMETEYGSADSLARVTISVGLAHAPRYSGKEEALRLADANLYEAKSSGRNLVVSGRLAVVERD